MKEKTLKQLRDEAEHLRKAINAGGLPTATAAYLADRLRSVDAAIYRAEVAANAES